MLQNAAPAVLLLVLMVIAAWLLVRFRDRLPGAAQRSGPALQVLGALALGPQHRVVTVQVGQGDQAVCLVLGVSPGSVSALHQMPLVGPASDAPTPAPSPGPTDAPANVVSPPVPFAQRLALYRKFAPHGR